MEEKKRRICPRCNGSTYIGEDIDCPDCGGTGTIEDDK